MIRMFNNVPDAVIVFEPISKLTFFSDDADETRTKVLVNYKVQYCNEQADKFFGFPCSSLDGEELEKNGYQLLQTRNL